MIGQERRAQVRIKSSQAGRLLVFEAGNSFKSSCIGDYKGFGAPPCTKTWWPQRFEKIFLILIFEEKQYR